MGSGGICIVEEGVFQGGVDADGFGFLVVWVLTSGLSSVGCIEIHCVVMAVVLPVVWCMVACMGDPSVIVRDGLVGVAFGRTRLVSVECCCSGWL